MTKAIIRNPVKKKKHKTKTSSKNFGYGGGIRGIKSNPLDLSKVLLTNHKKALRSLRDTIEKNYQSRGLKIELSIKDQTDIVMALNTLKSFKII